MLAAANPSPRQTPIPRAPDVPARGWHRRVGRQITAFLLDRDDHRLIHKPRVPQSALTFAKLATIEAMACGAPVDRPNETSMG